MSTQEDKNILNKPSDDVTKKSIDFFNEEKIMLQALSKHNDDFDDEENENAILQYIEELKRKNIEDNSLKRKVTFSEENTIVETYCICFKQSDNVFPGELELYSDYYDRSPIFEEESFKRDRFIESMKYKEYCFNFGFSCVKPFLLDGRTIYYHLNLEIFHPLLDVFYEKSKSDVQENLFLLDEELSDWIGIDDDDSYINEIQHEEESFCLIENSDSSSTDSNEDELFTDKENNDFLFYKRRKSSSKITIDGSLATTCVSPKPLTKRKTFMSFDDLQNNNSPLSVSASMDDRFSLKNLDNH